MIDCTELRPPRVDRRRDREGQESMRKTGTA